MYPGSLTVRPWKFLNGTGRRFFLLPHLLGQAARSGRLQGRVFAGNNFGSEKKS